MRVCRSVRANSKPSLKPILSRQVESWPSMNGASNVSIHWQEKSCFLFLAGKPVRAGKTRSTFRIQESGYPTSGSQNQSKGYRRMSKKEQEPNKRLNECVLNWLDKL